MTYVIIMSWLTSIKFDIYVQWTGWFITHTANKLQLRQDACVSSTNVDAWPHCCLMPPF